MHTASLNWPKRLLLSDALAAGRVMSVRASAFGANHRRSASPSHPLETLFTTERHDLPSLLNLKRALALLPAPPSSHGVNACSVRDLRDCWNPVGFVG